ncbi:zinc finger protein ZFP2 [Plutella xylostella]|uniref:zinc finger protein ZFP2 n=1 Tax=Plutella xylostella TaxID=51655 RepID=UPI002032B813|nr:zinc finger protein ZFP2 [Plutella xylostella]
MTEIIACRACLATHVTLYRDVDLYTQEVYQHLTNIAFESADGKPQLFCLECHSLLRRCQHFRDRCLRADGVLNQLLLSELGLNQDTISLFDRNAYNLTSKCSLSQIENINITPTKYSTENKDSIKHLKNNVVDDLEKNIVEDVKNNFLSKEIKEEYDNNDDNIADDSATQNDDELKPKSESDSDDDVPLQRLSHKKKEKLIRFKKKDESELIEEFAKEVILSKEEQIKDLNDRANSKQYQQSSHKCTICFKGFIDLSAYNNHMEKHDEKSGTHECEICKLRYETARQLRAHSDTVHCRKYDCLRCRHRSLTAHQAREHEKWHRGFTYSCKLCSKIFRKPTSLLTHTRKSHATQHACELCGDSFVGRHGLLMHKSKTHRSGGEELQEDVPESERFCKDCNILFVSLKAWKRHIITSVKHIQDSKDSDVCRVCNSHFATNTELVNHMKQHTRESIRNKRSTPIVKRVACSQCGVKFINNSKLQNHINRVHLGLKHHKNYVCEICGRNCTSNATLKYHQRTHTGERPYPCTECGKKFADSNQLRIHGRVHSGSRPYSCAVCAKSFRQRPSLNRHMRVHTGAKPYACPYCAKTFSQSNSLKLHIRTVHFKLPRSNAVKINVKQ